LKLQIVKSFTSGFAFPYKNFRFARGVLKLRRVLVSVHPKARLWVSFLRSKATKNLIVAGSAEILRGVYPEYTEGLRMTWRSFRMKTS
jgi:hypothetical protein